MTFWCILCQYFRKHTMQTEELGICNVCGSKNWAPTGDIG